MVTEGQKVSTRGRDKLSWKERVRIGLCGQAYCKRSPEFGRALCRPHRLACMPAKNKSRRKVYWEKKLTGICTYSGCHAAALGDYQMCQAHKDRCKEQAAKNWAREERRRRAAITNRKLAKRRKETGLCFQCSKPVATETRCAEHAEEHRQYHRERRRASGIPASTKPCSGCGRTGHRIEGCTAVAPSLPLEHYATARNFVEV